MTATAAVDRRSAGRPDRPVVVYDGDCPFCRKQIESIRRRDVDDVFEYLPRQTEGIESRFPRLAEGDFDAGMRLIHGDDSLSVGADAVYQIARRVRGWKRLAWLYRVPLLHGLLRAAYGWVARNRQRLPGGCTDESCKT
jgi:predicted DCC family thiol-disulfide oxidoreductase YuxK